MVKSIIYITFFITTLNGFSQNYSVKKIPLNKNVTTYSAQFYKNKLVVCSNKKDKITSTIIDESNAEPINLYLINISNADSMIAFLPKLKTKLNDGPISFNGSYNKAILSKNLNTSILNPKLKNNKNHLGLYEITLNENGIVTNETPLHFNNKNYNCTHPFLSIDGNTLYFSSNMPGGFGGYDIWKSIKNDTVWSKPINLGKVINSPKDELFPTTIDNNLYFSVNKNEIGGLDIYYADLETKNSPKILPKPLNSQFDDFGIISKNNLENGYLSSNRDSLDQIFEFNFVYPDFNNCDSIKKTYFCYNFFEESAINFDNLESLIYQWRINGETINGASIEYCFPSVGEYEIYLDVIDTIVNETFYNQSYIYLNIEYEIQPYITSLDSVLVNDNFTLNATNSYLPDVDIKEYYWFFSDGSKYNGDSIKHQFKKEGNYNVKLGVLATNGEKFCVYKSINCSNNSSKNNTNYLSLKEGEKKGIINVNNAGHYYEAVNDTSKKVIVYRIEAHRTNEKLDTSSNTYKSLLADDNFMVKYLDKDKTYIYLIGKWNKLIDAHLEWQQMVKDGNDNLVLRSFTEEEFLVDNIFILKNIQFDFNSWDFSPSAYVELDKLVDAIKSQPKYFLEISAFTDATGSAKNNLKLSKKRAKAVKDYLIKKGISAYRIKTIGMGEKNPIGDNSTKEGMQLNRRVEFKFVKK